MSEVEAETDTDVSEGRAAQAEALTRAFFQHWQAQQNEVETELGHKALRIELPAALADAFRTPVLTVAFHAGVDDGIEVVSAGSRVFDDMLTWLRDKGQVAWVPLVQTHEVPLQPDGVEDATRVVEPRYDIELAVRIALVAEDRQESLALVVVPAFGERTEVEVSIVEQATEDGLCDPESSLVPPTQGWMESQLEAAMDHLATWSRKRVQPREQVIFERLSREVQRLTNYYGELMAQHEREDDVRQQLATDLDRRVAEEVANHQLSVELEVLCFAVVGRMMGVFEDPDGDTWTFDTSTGEWAVYHGAEDA